MSLFRHVVRASQARRSIHSSAARYVDLKAIEHDLRTRSPVIIHDSFTWRPSFLLHRSLAGESQYTRLDSNVYGKPSGQAPTYLTPGHHLVYFTTPSHPSSLLPDGTDDHHYPGGPFTLRLWAGGCVRFNKLIKLNGRAGILRESIKDVRVTGSSGSEKIFLEIERRIALGQPENNWLKYLDQQALLEAADDSDACGIVESRTLCFLRDDTESGSRLDVSRRGPPPPPGPDFSISALPTPALLFRFSALTFNAHAIHIDPEFTRKTYGLPNLLVHGPLCLALMLKAMVKSLQQEAVDRNQKIRMIQEIQYKNLRPVFVNEEMRVCGKKKQEGDVGEHVKPEEEEWDVWIETGSGDEASVAVRGTVKVRETKFSPRRGQFGQSDLLGATTT